MEFIEEARKRITEEERVKKVQDEEHRLRKLEQEASSAAAVQEQMIVLESERMRIELEARQLVIEREAQRLAAEKEAAIAAEMERLRNRTPLEKLQDDFEELKLQLAKKPIIEVKRVQLLDKETLKESWEALLEWQHWKKMYDDACKAWSVQEHNILPYNKEIVKYGFSRKVDGTVQEAYPLSEVSVELQKLQEELKVLQGRYTVHKLSHQTAVKHTHEMMCRTRNLGGNDTTHSVTINYTIAMGKEKELKVLADREETEWKENKEKDKLNEKISFLTTLKSLYTNLIRSFQAIGCYDENYIKAVENAKKVTGIDDLQAAWEQTFKLIVAARTA